MGCLKRERVINIKSVSKNGVNVYHRLNDSQTNYSSNTTGIVQVYSDENAYTAIILSILNHSMHVKPQPIRAFLGRRSHSFKPWNRHSQKSITKRGKVLRFSVLKYHKSQSWNTRPLLVLVHFPISELPQASFSPFICKSIFIHTQRKPIST